MLGMHGTYEANLAMNQADLIVNIGARFDDRVTGRLDAFAPNSRKVHIDIDRSSINKTVRIDHAVVADAGHALEDMVRLWKARQHPKPDLSDWLAADPGMARARLPRLPGGQGLRRHHAGSVRCVRCARRPRRGTRSSPPRSASTRCGRRSISASNCPTSG
ncbi:hypothetical protein AB5I41_17000 [Sphingomonas sp. MMS24-JH45]